MSYQKYNIQNAFIPACPLQDMLVRPKELCPMLYTSACVYCIPCVNFNKVFIDETSMEKFK